MSAAPRRPADLLVPWACLALAGGFWAWLALAGVEDLSAPESAVRGLGMIAGLAALAALVAAAVLFALGARATLARASFAAALCYLACLKMAGLALAPWLALAAAAVVAVGLRAPPAPGPALLLLHAMGAMAGAHLVFALPRYLAALPAFRDVLAALWRLL